MMVIKNGEKLQLNSRKIEVWIIENEMKKGKSGANTQMNWNSSKQIEMVFMYIEAFDCHLSHFKSIK
jgi:hypothetical protein